MTSIFTRSALEFWGKKPVAPDVASVVIDYRGRRVVTWSDVMRERRERQARILNNHRHVDRWRAWKVWVAFYDMDLFGGWQAFIECRRERIWIDRDRDWLIPHLMKLFPLVLPFQPDQKPYIVFRNPSWERWQVEFAKQFKRRKHHRQPLGTAYVWWNGLDAPQRTIQHDQPIIP